MDTSSAEIGHGEVAGSEGMDTTHFTVVDADGNIVTNTYTINDSFGNKITVEGAGFLLNNEMDDFAPKPGSPNAYGLIQGEANAVAARKRPLSSMTPTIVLKDGKLWFAVGSPGGPTIINTVTQVIINIIDHGMNIQQAIDWPRVHHQWMPDVLNFERRWLEELKSSDAGRAMLSELEKRGHRIEPCGSIGIVQLIRSAKSGQGWDAASDPRKGGKRAGF